MFFFFILQPIIKDYLIRIIHLRIVGITETEGIVFPKLFIEAGSENLSFSVIICGSLQLPKLVCLPIPKNRIPLHSKTIQLFRIITISIAEFINDSFLFSLGFCSVYFCRITVSELFSNPDIWKQDDPMDLRKVWGEVDCGKKHVSTHPKGSWQVKGAGNTRATVITSTLNDWSMERTDGFVPVIPMETIPFP